MNRYVVVPHHGAGRARLVRQGRTVLFTTGDGPAAAALAGWCRLFGDRPSAEILQELARVTSDNPTLGAFALLVLDDDGIEVAVSGPLPISTHGSGGVEVLQSGDGLSRRRVTDATVVALTVPGAIVDPLLELERGTVAADGFEIRVVRPIASDSPWAAPAPSPAPAAPKTPTDATGEMPKPVIAEAVPEAAVISVVAVAEATAPAPAPVAVVPEAIVSLHAADLADLADLPAATPLPITGRSPEPVPATPAAQATHDESHDHGAPEPADDRARVRGLQCARGHFNDPRARFCGVCGIAMHQASFILVEDVRPPLGVLVFGDGSYQTLAKTAIVGRDPVDDPSVISGEAVSLPLADPTNTLSRVHADIRLLEWDVQIVDRGSTNGTFVWAPGQTAWERLAANAARTLQPGTHVSFGRLTATFESSQRQG